MPKFKPNKNFKLSSPLKADGPKVTSNMTKQEVINSVRTYNETQGPKTAASVNAELRKWRAGGGGVKPSVEKKTTKTVKPSIQEKKEGREETYIEYVTGLGLRDEKNIPDLFK